MIDNKTIGKQLAMLRIGKGLTQAELGERLRVSYQAVSKWERGETARLYTSQPGTSKFPLHS